MNENEKMIDKWTREGLMGRGIWGRRKNGKTEKREKGHKGRNTVYALLRRGAVSGKMKGDIPVIGIRKYIAE